MPTAALESDPTPSSSLVRNKNLAFFASPHTESDSDFRLASGSFIGW
jgi:hypothetical protein